MFRGFVDRYKKYYFGIEKYDEDDKTWSLLYTTNDIYETWEEAKEQCDFDVERLNKWDKEVKNGS